MKRKVEITLFLALGLLAVTPLVFADEPVIADVEPTPIPSATIIPCSGINGARCLPIVSSGNPGVATDSVKAAEYWAENKRPTFGKMPRAFVQTQDCKWFNTIKKECEGK